MAIGAKLSKVMTACRYMAQDGENKFQGYKYTKAASMFGEINKALTEQGLYVTTKFELVESRDVTTANNLSISAQISFSLASNFFLKSRSSTNSSFFFSNFFSMLL